LLPRWLRAWPSPFSRRRIWTGAGALWRGVPPLRGWHAQQLRKMSLPQRAPEDVILFADSDVLFLRPFDMRSLSGPAGTRLFRAKDAIRPEMCEHVRWSRSAATMLGLPAPALPAPDYITHLVSWRSANVAAMLRHIEQSSGRDWVAALASHRQFSEYLIYGRFVETVLTPSLSGHELVSTHLSRSYWSQEDVVASGFGGAGVQLGPGQVAIGVQSFLGQPVERLEALFEAS
jgi:hypothetical protein